jgi:hypothetical protein
MMPLRFNLQSERMSGHPSAFHRGNPVIAIGCAVSWGTRFRARTAGLRFVVVRSKRASCGRAIAVSRETLIGFPRLVLIPAV